MSIAPEYTFLMLLWLVLMSCPYSSCCQVQSSQSMLHIRELPLTLTTNCLSNPSNITLQCLQFCRNLRSNSLLSMGIFLRSMPTQFSCTMQLLQLRVHDLFCTLVMLSFFRCSYNKRIYQSILQQLLQSCSCWSIQSYLRHVWEWR